MFTASTMARPIFGWREQGGRFRVGGRRRTSSKISIGMKNADSPMASQTAHFTRKASPEAADHQKQAVKHRPRGDQACTLRGVIGVQPVADVVEKSAFRVKCTSG